MKRLFVAVDIDDVVRGQVSRISAAARDAIATRVKASWVLPERMHLTLHFLGTADAALEQRVHEVLARPVSEGAFDLTFDGLGFFPARGSPRVLWLAVGEGLAPLRRIHKVLAEELRLQPDHEGPFTPHLTLARFRDRVPRGIVAKAAEIPAAAGPSRIDRVTLYESRLSPKGPTYLPMAVMMLNE